MKKYSVIVFICLINLLILLTIDQANAQALVADTTQTPGPIYTIEDVYEMHKKQDTVHIGEIIAIKLKAGDPVNSITTLYIDGLAIEGLKKEVRVTDNTVLFKIDEKVQNAVDQYLEKESAYINLVKVNVSVGDGTVVSTVSKPMFLQVKNKIKYVGVYIFVLSLLFIGLIYISLKNRILKDDANLYFSLGRTQLFLWTIVFGVCYLYIWFSTSSLPDITNSVLIILGISAGTTAAAKVIENAPAPSLAVAQGNPAVLVAPAIPRASEGWLKDILSDGSSISVSRFQNVMFNIVFGIIFIQRATSGLVLPEFDTNALILMGISSGTYAGLKITEAK